MNDRTKAKIKYSFTLLLFCSLLAAFSYWLNPNKWGAFCAGSQAGIAFYYLMNEWVFTK